jgi:hypothetical protein
MIGLNINLMVNIDALVFIYYELPPLAAILTVILNFLNKINNIFHVAV